MNDRVTLVAFVVAVASVSCGGAPRAVADASAASSATLRVVPSTRPVEMQHLPDPPCPPQTYWDGHACAHATATCGGWNGSSCDPSGVSPPYDERAWERDFARIDAEARAVCNEDDQSRQVYQDNVKEVVAVVDAAMGRLEKLRLAFDERSPREPRWEVVTRARLGSLYDCIWTSLRQALPELFTPQQQALLTKLNGVLTQLNNLNGTSTAQAQVNAPNQVRTKWREARDLYLALLETKLVAYDVSAILLARRYSFDGFGIARVHARLPVIASILGDEKMARLLGDMTDPTDPEPDATKRRRIVYVPGAFGVPP